MAKTEIMEENAVDSCRTILYFMREYNEETEEHKLIREALLEDLLWKACSIADIKKAEYLCEGLYCNASTRTREVFSAEKLSLGKLESLPKRKVHRDIGIITVIKKELDAVMINLEMDPETPPEGKSDIFRYWSTEIETENRKPLSIVMTMVGEPRNVPCAIAVEHMLSHFHVDLMVLIGIAAGPKGKVKRGDVVTAERVYDYEHVRSELIGTKVVKRPRPANPEIPKEILNDINLTYSDGQLVDPKFKNLLKRLPEDQLPGKVTDIRPRFYKGTIAAGEELIADGSLAKMRKKLDQRIKAADQEDSGFAQACIFRKLRWCIFRGVADYGDPHKNKNDKWQSVAALAAARAAIRVLKSNYRRPDEGI